MLDSSALLGEWSHHLVAAAHLHYYEGYWSSWIVAEVVRKRTEWIARRASKDRCDVAETMRRLQASRERVNHMIEDLSRDLRSVDYHDASPADLSWLTDEDDRVVMRTALAAAASILVTENRRDFPLEQTRNGVLLLNTLGFLARLYKSNREAEADIRTYLEDQLQT